MDAGSPAAAWRRCPETISMPLRLHDYIVEHAVLDMASDCDCCGSRNRGVPLWRKQTQYAAGHTLNDYYSLTPEVRRQTPVLFLLERRWPSKGTGGFRSLMQEWEVKNAVSDSLIRIVSSNHVGEVPFMLYEQWHVPVPELGIELSVIFQLAWHSQMPGRSLSIQKFMAGCTQEVALGFMHMANVFCRISYGLPPESVEIYNLLEGRSDRHDCGAVPLQESLDYLRLLAPLMEQELHRPYV
ncbi:hypothetical protein F4V43_04965 [Paenibacillus spiritus]|uniref:Uncharacterized protein n=1 Tax=Paenibacillus spiritus TaxID=2496557 RepID=A0A5J5GDP4_9BACL|nr:MULTISPECIES: hypothetical protein [Paenibacillus]KAA9006316.1 hypothetical protein F4V43_04965 [Paenibacillus spiritus]